MNTVKLAALAALLGGATAFAQSTPTTTDQSTTPAPSTPQSTMPDFATLDINGDGSLSRDELRNTVGLTFDDLDADRNGSVSNTEYRSAASKAGTTDPERDPANRTPGTTTVPDPSTTVPPTDPVNPKDPTNPMPQPPRP